MEVTLKDVAKIANVSPSTISRVISNHPKISDSTKKRVLEVMDELNYHPNMIARSLANKSSQIVGVILPDQTEQVFQHPFYPEVIRGISSAATKYDYSILLPSVNKTNEESIINKYVMGKITDGIILMSSRVNDSLIEMLQNMGFPFSVIGRPLKNENRINWVDNDNFDAGYTLTKYLIDNEHKRIAFLGMSYDYIVTLDRFNGYKKALKDSGIKFDENFVIEDKFISLGASNEKSAVFDLLRHNDRPTAIIACDDFIAFDIIKYISEYYSIPDDVSIVSFNNTLLSNYTTPTLTSVEVSPYKLGQKAFEILHSSITSKSGSFQRVLIPTEIKFRDSVKKIGE